jgi:DNA repair protein RadC
MKNKQTNSEFSSSSKKEHCHSGHRQRKKQLFLDKGIEGLPDHEKMELMLFYSIPNGDVNPIAHSLIKKFGDLKSVIDASYNDLTEIKGCGANTASMICLFRMLAKEYFSAKYKYKLNANQSDNLCSYCKSLFITSDIEQVQIILFDDELNLMGTKKICDGTPGKTNIPFRTIMDLSLKAKCNRIVLSHNHPLGTMIPSKDDIYITKDLWTALNKFEIELIDHIIVGFDGEWSMRFNSTMPELWSNGI